MTLFWSFWTLKKTFWPWAKIFHTPLHVQLSTLEHLCRWLSWGSNHLHIKRQPALLPEPQPAQRKKRKWVMWWKESCKWSSGCGSMLELIQILLEESAQQAETYTCRITLCSYAAGEISCFPACFTIQIYRNASTVLICFFIFSIFRKLLFLL